MLDKNIVELELDSGWKVRCRPVPPLASQALVEREEFWYPSPPTIEVSTMKGRASETVPAPDDSDESREYWSTCRRIDQAREVATRDFAYGYGIKEWSRDGKTWLSAPPEGWESNPVLAEAFGYTDPNPRMEFIKGELIVSSADVRAVAEVLFPTEMKSLAVEEVTAVVENFQDQVQGNDAEGVGDGDSE